MILHYSIIFTILAITSFAYYKYAIKTNIIDTPSERSSHTIPTIRGGGIVFFIAVILFFIFQLKIDYPYFLVGFLLLSIMGFIDDKKELSAKIRFPFQLIAVGLILYESGLFTTDLPIVFQITGFVVGVGFINAFNFMDGINGITGFYTVAILIPLLYINNHNQLLSNDLFIILLLAVVVFGFYNFRKNALFFAGDIGSMALAAVLLFIISKYMIALQAPILLLTVLIYGLDSALTIIYRIYLKEDIAQPHRWHLYQKLVDISKLSHLKVAGIYTSLQLLIGYFVVTQTENNAYKQTIYLIIAIVLGTLTYGVLQYHYAKKTR